MDMDRRGFLKAAGIGGMTMLLSGLEPFKGLVRADVSTYSGATYLTPAYRVLKYGVDGFVDQLKKHSNGVMKIEFFDSGTLLKADELVAGLKVGTIQFMFHTTSYITRSFPILGIMDLPGIGNHLYAHGERLKMESALWTLINAELAKENLFMLTTGGGVFEPQYIWSGRNKVIRLADLQGKRCRIVSPAATEVLEQFGVTGLRIPSSQTYLALQRGQVDVLVANISTVIGRNLYEQLKYCFKMPVLTFSIPVFLLKDRWDRLSGEEKSVFWKAGQWYDQHQVQVVNETHYPKAYWPIIEKAGIQIVLPTAEERQLFSRRAQPAWASWKGQVGEKVGQRAIGLALGKA